jgi:hypothetical protein
VILPSSLVTVPPPSPTIVTDSVAQFSVAQMERAADG